MNGKRRVRVRDVETRRQELRTKVLLGMKVFYVEIIPIKRFLCCNLLQMS